MFKRLTNWLNDESGTGIVDMLMLLPLVLLLFSYILCFSQLCYANQVALTAADIGCRVAITQDSSASARTRAEEAARAYVDQSKMGIQFDTGRLEYPSWDRGKICTYSVDLKIKTIMPLAMKGAFGTEQKVSKSSHMMIEKEQ